MWGRLFPSMLSEIHAFDSYNSLDLDSVDEGITNKLYKYLEEDSWHHLICTFLFLSRKFPLMLTNNK